MSKKPTRLQVRDSSLQNFNSHYTYSNRNSTGNVTSLQNAHETGQNNSDHNSQLKNVPAYAQQPMNVGIVRQSRTQALNSQVKSMRKDLKQEVRTSLSPVRDTRHFSNLSNLFGLTRRSNNQHTHRSNQQRFSTLTL